MQHTLIVENIKCGGCANSIKNKLNTIEGISDLAVQVEKGQITFDATDENTVSTVESTLSKMGYPKVGENHLSAKAKSYVSCMIGRMN
jgi:copper chaperone